MLILTTRHQNLLMDLKQIEIADKKEEIFLITCILLYANRLFQIPNSSFMFCIE